MYLTWNLKLSLQIFKQIPFETPTYIYPPHPPPKTNMSTENQCLVQMYSHPKLVPLLGGHSFVFRGVNNQQLTCLPMFQLINTGPFTLDHSPVSIMVEAPKITGVEYVGTLQRVKVIWRHKFRVLFQGYPDFPFEKTVCIKIFCQDSPFPVSIVIFISWNTAFIFF